MNAIEIRIAARQALDMTAEEYDAHQAFLADSLRAAQDATVARALRAGMYGTAVEVDVALKNCELLGVS